MALPTHLRASTLVATTAPLAQMVLPRDPLALGAHLRACDRARGPAFALRCAAERVHDWVGPRFCTTLLVATAFIALLAQGA